MIQFTTKVNIPNYPFTLDHTERGLILGSCFATNIGTMMQRGKMNVVLNPQGVLFNPLSISGAFSNVSRGRRFEREELFRHNGLWHSPHHHGSFSSSDPEQVLSNINIPHPRQYDYVLVTLGSAWVYERVTDRMVVTNCHKRGEDQFVRRRMDLDEIISSLRPLAEHSSRLILTVSPVRHLRDGLIENQASKSLLRIACDILEHQYDTAHYFPSYEIMIDELRDYRFYDTDMTHPSAPAVEYIWQEFSRCIINEPSRELISQCTTLHSAMQHRPLHTDSDEYRRFRESMLRRCKKTADKYPDVDFSEELRFFG